MVSVLLVALCAATLASLQLASWAALGSFALRPLRASSEDDDGFLVTTILLGGALTSCAYAVLARSAGVHAALAGGAVLTLVPLAMGWRGVRRAIATVYGRAATVWAGNRLAYVCLLAVLLLYVVHASGPPRSADVMRYHLAHIRQIVFDGAWLGISDLHYAFPFGWSLNLLPFEFIGLPETAHFVSLGLWIVAALTLLSWMNGRGVGAHGFFVLLAVGAQIMVVEAVTSATADSYSIFLVTAAVVLIGRDRPTQPVDALVMGFVAGVGAQSRYQLIAVGLALAAVFVVQLQREERRSRLLVAFIAGGAVALTLAVPFYLSNFTQFGNPVWPLLADGLAGDAPYAERIAARYASFQAGSRAPLDILRSVGALLTNPLAFPVPLLVFTASFLVFWRGAASGRDLGVFTTVFLGCWLALQPRLYVRYSIIMTPIAIAGTAMLLGRWAGGARVTRFVRGGCVLMLAGFLAMSAVYRRDFIRYVLTGDRDRFHEITWFHATFKWLNANVPPDGRLLVIIGSAQTYPLERWYRRADPDFSAVVDWTAVTTAAGLDSVLRAHRIEWVVYDDRDWSDAPGGPNMTRVVREALDRRMFVPVATIDEYLSLSRMRRLGTNTTVRILRRAE